MKRIAVFLIHLLCLIVLMVAPTSVFAASSANGQSQQIQTVQSLEDTLFAVHYDQEGLDARVNRLEGVVFGQPQTGSLDARISKLKSSLSPSALGPLSPTAKSTGTASNTNSAAGSATPVAANSPVSSQSKSNQNSKAKVAYPTSMPNTAAQPTTAGSPAMATQSAPTAGETDYPTVSQMEQKLFGKAYTQEDITGRLNRLEKEVFKTPQTGSLADRVDNLRLVVLGDVGAPANNNTMAYGVPAGAMSSYGGYPGPSNSYAPQYNQNGPPVGSTYQPYSSYGGASGYPQPPNYGSGYGGDPYSGTPIASSQPYATPYGGQYYGGSSGNYPQTASQTSYSGAYPSTSPSSPTATTPDMLAAMTEVEKEVIGHTYPSEPMNTRLDRVENKVFHTTSPELSNEERIQRVIAVSSAGGAPETTKAKAKHTIQTLLPIILTILPMVLL